MIRFDQKFAIDLFRTRNAQQATDGGDDTIHFAVKISGIINDKNLGMTDPT
jgi:hypothetical protein